MSLTKNQAIAVNALLSLAVVVLGAYLIEKQKIILTLIICAVGILAIVIFNLYRHQRSKGTSELIFSEDFSVFQGWIPYLEGNILQSDEFAYEGKFSLKKSGFNDPNGGFKGLKKMKRGFVFTGWIYRPSNSEGGPADRLAIEDEKGNGYGFAIKHEYETFIMFIEKRVEGAFDKNLSYAQIECPLKSLKDIWYCFTLQVTKQRKISLNIDCANQRIHNIQADDSDFTVFNKVAVHGGYPYFVDSLKIRKI